jgi:hypothetical protein
LPVRDLSIDFGQRSGACTQSTGCSVSCEPRLSIDEAAQRLARDPRRAGSGVSISATSCGTRDLSKGCCTAARQLQLTSRSSRRSASTSIRASRRFPCRLRGVVGNVTGVAFAGESPIGVSLAQAMAGPPKQDERSPAPPASRPAGNELTYRSIDGTIADVTRETTPAEPTTINAWPRLDAPGYVPALEPFDVVVGLGADRQQGVAGGQVTLNAPARDGELTGTSSPFHRCPRFVCRFRIGRESGNCRLSGINCEAGLPRPLRGRRTFSGLTAGEVCLGEAERSRTALFAAFPPASTESLEQHEIEFESISTNVEHPTPVG